MSCLRSYLAESVAVFVTSDAQMVFLTIALAGSLCCSIIWRLFALLSMRDGLNVAPVKHRLSKHLRTRRLLNSIRQESSSGDEFQCISKCFPFEKQSQPPVCRMYARDACILPSAGQSYTSHLQQQQQTVHYDKSATEKPRQGDQVIEVHNSQVALSIPEPEDLEEMHAIFSGLTECPTRIGFLGTQLVSLNLSHNSLSCLPDEIGCLLGLEELYLGRNQLRSLPETFRNLRRLTELDLQCNELVSLGDELTALTCLRRLLVNNNLLSQLPSDIHHLHDLELLDLSFNKLSWLPDGLCNIFSLLVLNVSHNPLVYLPENMNKLVRLTHLLAGFCQLVSLPRSVSRCLQLVFVQLSKNRLQYLPDGIGQLFNLQFLSLDGNCLRYLPVTISSLRGCHIMVENNCFISPSVNSPVLVNVANGSAAVEHQLRRGAASLVELAAICLLQNKVMWQHENIPQTLKDVLTNTRYCICCDRPLVHWQRMQISSHSLVSKTGQLIQVPLVQSTCPLQVHKCPCTFINI